MIKPVAYAIEQFGKVGFYTSREFFLLPLTGEMLEKGDAKPLYAIPEGYALVPIEQKVREYFHTPIVTQFTGRSKRTDSPHLHLINISV